MRKTNYNWDNVGIVLIVVLSSVCLTPIIHDIKGISFNTEINIIELLNIIVTIILAFCISRILEKRSNKEKADNEIMVSITKNLIQDCSIFSRNLYENNLSYFEASNVQKRINLGLDDVVIILERLNKNTNDIKSLISKVKTQTRSLNKQISSITYKDEEPENYLLVNENMITEISPSRMVVVQRNLRNIQSILYQIWLNINDVI